MHRILEASTSRRFRLVHLCAGLLAVVAYATATPGSVAQAALEVGMHATVAPLILLGVAVHRPSRPAGWYIIAGSQVSYAIGNVLGTWLPATTGAERPFPAPADGFYLVAYAGLVAGVAVLLVHRSRGLGAGALLDTATVSVALSSLAWVFLLDQMLMSMHGAAGATATAYVLMDVALVAVLVHIALAPGARSAALLLLATAVLAQITGDVLYTVGSLHGTFVAGAPAFVAWMCFYVLLGAAAVHPSMRRLAEPDSAVRGLSANGRIVLLAAAAMLPPTALLLNSQSRRVSVLAVITMVTFAGVLLRLMKVQGQLQESSRLQQLKDQLLSIVSHEIRTPLTIVSVALSTLARGVVGKLEPKQEDLVSMASGHTERLIRLVNDLLDVQRASSVRDELELGPVSLVGVVCDALEGLRDCADAEGVILRSDVEDLTVEGHAGRLCQVITNLAGNALKFSEPGGEITVSAHQRGDEALVRIRDEGRGIPAEMHEKIFEPFQQVDASDSRTHNGTGLGLAICRSLVDQHGGRIWVESAPGAGATFLFTLPLAREAAAPAPSGPAVAVATTL